MTIKGEVYKLTSLDTGYNYIGSTTDIKIRLYNHKSSGKLQKGILSAEIITKGRYRWTTLEYGDYNDKNEIRQREQYWIDNTENVVNLRRAYTSREEERERKARYWKFYYEDNKHRLAEKIDCPECGKEVSKRHLKEHMEAPNHNRVITAEEIEAQRIRTLNMRNQRFLCPCGGTYMYSRKSSHMKTPRHVEWVELNDERGQRYKINCEEATKVIENDMNVDKAFWSIADVLENMFVEPKIPARKIRCECGYEVFETKLKYHMDHGFHKFLMDKRNEEIEEYKRRFPMPKNNRYNKDG